MPKKSKAAQPADDFVGILHELLKHMDNRFDRLETRFDTVEERLDQIQFSVSGQDRRISILEDRMRMVATKLGLEFRKSV